MPGRGAPGYYIAWRRAKGREPRRSSLSPPLAKASAGLPPHRPGGGAFNGSAQLVSGLRTHTNATLVWRVLESPDGWRRRDISHCTPHQALFIPLVYNQAECVYGAADGRTTVNVVPSPKLESTQIRPSWASTIDLTIESPSPVPLTSAGTFLARKNLSKR